MAELTVIRWRDIPAQVVAQSGRKRASVQLSERFQEAIDLAASHAGLIGSDEYLAEWRRQTRACGEDLQAEAGTEAQRLEAAYDTETLLALVRADGVAGAGEAP